MHATIEASSAYCRLPKPPVCASSSSFSIRLSRLGIALCHSSGRSSSCTARSAQRAEVDAGGLPVQQAATTARRGPIHGTRLRTRMRRTNWSGMGPSLSTTLLAARQKGMPAWMAPRRSTWERVQRLASEARSGHTTRLQQAGTAATRNVQAAATAGIATCTLRW